MPRYTDWERDLDELDARYLATGYEPSSPLAEIDEHAQEQEQRDRDAEKAA